MQATTTRPTITAPAGGEGVVSHAGSRLLANVTDRITLTAQLAEELAGLRKPRAGHDPGRVLVDMAVAVADGATTISDLAMLADQAALFGQWRRTRRAGGCSTASTPRGWVRSRGLGPRRGRPSGRNAPSSPGSHSRRDVLSPRLFGRGRRRAGRVREEVPVSRRVS